MKGEEEESNSQSSSQGGNQHHHRSRRHYRPSSRSRHSRDRRDRREGGDYRSGGSQRMRIPSLDQPLFPFKEFLNYQREHGISTHNHDEVQRSYNRYKEDHITRQAEVFF